MDLLQPLTGYEEQRMGVRRRAREMALQALYTMDLTGHFREDLSEPLYEEDRWPSSARHARTLLAGVVAHLRLIDEAVQGHADHWSVSRMNLIDRNILRIAAYELLFCEDIPMKVSINEAIELAKIYGTRETSGFLNGILDKVAKTHGVKTRAGCIREIPGG
jgi:transcription antitermination protein NusB